MNKKNLCLLTGLVIVLSLITFVGHSQSSLLPWVKFNGTYQVTSGVGTGALTLNATVYEMDYENGNIWKCLPNSTNPPDLNVETICGAKVVLSGATRTGNYSFNGDMVNPDDVRIKIISPDGFIYFDANLADSQFVQSGTMFVWLNQFLDANNPDTLNLYNIVLNTDANHPSRYIQELATYLSASNVSGLKMQLRVPTNGTFTTTASGSITFGLIDGLQSLNTPPVADAGPNEYFVSSDNVASTTLNGTATDADGDPLTCRWMYGAQVLTGTGDGWVSVVDGSCPLDLSSILFGVGTYTLTLEVSDGQAGSSDDMVLTVQNSAPHAAPGGGSVSEINADVYLIGQVSDFDGDSLEYKWLEGTNVLCSGNIQGIAGGTPVTLSPCIKSGLGLGIHIISLEVSDQINLPDKQDITVVIKDSSAPTISPVASGYIMWPPNHIMVNIAINANAVDNSGLPVTLTASVASNEPIDGLGDGDMGPDWTTPVIEQNTGRIDLQLRRERSGSGSGRVYTITITAADSSGNTSTAYVNITVPHDMAKKK
jgi:hypothetical protein